MFKQNNNPFNKRKDPVVGTGKKPKGSGRRLYTDENPKDTVSIKYATVEDARKTIKKVKNINKPYARKIQILTVLEQRAKFGGKPKQAAMAKAAKKALKRGKGAGLSKEAYKAGRKKIRKAARKDIFGKVGKFLKEKVVKLK